MSEHDVPSFDSDYTRSEDTGSRSVEVLGPYRPLELIGVGGMGEVWLAEQLRPVRRRVALKVIKAGMDTAQVIARFEAERQALALMDHPAIARVFDAGASRQGRPYFVMEYVRGESITAYAARHALPIRARIELFLRVCDGVQHAHQKGVIHRDLKPTNVLVTLQDDQPVPKIIDFGLAKAMTQSLTERTLYTELGMLVGTPEYMSPEQAEMGGLDIDTRTDVYALGVILYELLTGALPLELKTLREKTLEEMRRTIREVDPPRPSTRVTSGVQSGAAPLHPPADAGRIASQLRGDLDWITMKALEKDRARRYGSASDLAADLRRHLDNLPVLAGPPSTIYRMNKFVRRHRVGVSAAATLSALLVLFAVASTIQAQRLARERDRANHEAEVALRVTDFLTGLFRVQSPSESRGQSVTARELLDAGARQIAGMRDQPEVQARLMDTMGSTYDSLGLYAPAQSQLEAALDVRRRVLGVEHPDTARSITALAALQVRRQQYEPATKLFEEAIQMRERVAGPDDPIRLAAMQDLGWLLSQRGRPHDGERLVREALAAERRVLGNEHPNTLLGMSRLAFVMQRQGRGDEEEKLLREALEVRRRVQGEDHPETLAAGRTLAGNLFDQGRMEESESLLRHNLELTRRVLGPDHPQTASTLNSLALVLQSQKKFAEAETLFRSVIDLWRRSLGPDSDNTLLALNNLGNLFLSQHRNQDAEALFSELLEPSRRVRGNEHPRTLMIMNNLGMAYLNLGRHAEAERLLTETIATGRRALGERHPMTLTFMVSLAETHAAAGDRDRALRVISEAVDLGYHNVSQVREDEYFKNLSDDPRFKALVARMEKSGGARP